MPTESRGSHAARSGSRATRRPNGETRRTGTPRRAGTARPGRMLTGLAAALALAAGAAAIAAWSTPAQVARATTWREVGALTYQAPTQPGSVYGAAGVRTGQPVYASAVDTLSLRYRYRFSTAAPADLRGTARLVATMGNGAGVTRPVSLGSKPVSFTGTRVVLEGRLTLAALGRLETLFESAGDNGLGVSFPVTITPEITVSGHVGRAAVHTSFTDPIEFALASGTLSPPAATAPSAGAPVALGATASSLTDPDPLGHTVHGSVMTSARPAELAGLVPVRPARTASGIAFLAAVLLLLVAVTRRSAADPAGATGSGAGGGTGADAEHRRLVRRHRGMLVEAAELPWNRTVATVVSLASFSDLLKVARRLECPVLHQADDGHVYVVVDNQTIYRYRPDDPSTGSRRPTRAATGGDPFAGLDIANEELITLP